MARKKKIEVEEEFTECYDGQSKRENEMIDLLKQIVNQNEQVIQILSKLKERFI